MDLSKAKLSFRSIDTIDSKFNHKKLVYAIQLLKQLSEEDPPSDYQSFKSILNNRLYSNDVAFSKVWNEYKGKVDAAKVNYVLEEQGDSETDPFLPI